DSHLPTLSKCTFKLLLGSDSQSYCTNITLALSTMFIKVRIDKMHAEGSSGDIHEASPVRTPCALDWLHECRRYCLRLCPLQGPYPDQFVKIHHNASTAFGVPIPTGPTHSGAD